MLNFPLIPTKAELRSAAAIERRRVYEEARKCRIFNSRFRTIGIDKDGLEKQIAEKKRLADEEKRLEDAYNEQKRREDQALLLIEEQIKKERRVYTEELNTFRRCHQRPEDRREFDLNDPEYLKKLKPIRTDDEDPRITISSIQRFEGEDLCKAERLKIQAEQQSAWYQQQIREKKQAEDMRCMADEEYQKAIIARDQRALQLDRLERDLRAKMEQVALELNKAMAHEKEERMKAEAQQDQEDNMAHMYNVITSDMMTENRDVGYSNFGPPHIQSTMYRGMTDKQLAALKEEQLKQIEEKKAAKEAEKQREEDFVTYMSNLAHAAEMKAQEMENLRRRKNQELSSENKMMGAMHRSQMAQGATETDPCHYFNQFGTSTR